MANQTETRDRRETDQIVMKAIPSYLYDKSVEQERARFSDAELLRIYRDMSILRLFSVMKSELAQNGSFLGASARPAAVFRAAAPAYGGEAAAVGQAFLLTDEDLLISDTEALGDDVFLAKALSAIHRLPEEELTKSMAEFRGGVLWEKAANGSSDQKPEERGILAILCGAICDVLGYADGFAGGAGSAARCLPRFGLYPQFPPDTAPAVAAGAALYQRVQERQGIACCCLYASAYKEGALLEAVSFASMNQYHTLWEDRRRGGLPVLYQIIEERNPLLPGPETETQSCESPARIAAAAEPRQLYAERVRGDNPLAVVDAIRRKREKLLSGNGPALLNIVVSRFSKLQGSTEESPLPDPLAEYRFRLIEAGVAIPSDFDAIHAQAEAWIRKALKLAVSSAPPSEYDSRERETRFAKALYCDEKRDRMLEGRPKFLENPDACSRSRKLAENREALTIADAQFEAIFEKFKADAAFLAFGAHLRKTAKADADPVFEGLADVVPYMRLFNTAADGNTLIGAAFGYALSGGRVMATLPADDFQPVRLAGLMDTVHTARAANEDLFPLSIILRFRCGKSSAGASLSACMRIPGLKCCLPAAPWEAKGLLTNALNGTDPVAFFEAENILFEVDARNDLVPAQSYEIPFGDVLRTRIGGDLTILSIGSAYSGVMAAVDELSANYDIEAELFLLHSLVPLDFSLILDSVRKTGRVVLVGLPDAPLSELSQQLGEWCFDQLDGPPITVFPDISRGLGVPEAADFCTDILDAIHSRLLPLKGYAPKSDRFTELEQIRRAKEGF